MITRERAVELVEALLTVQRAALAGYPEPAIVQVDEHALGWLVYWNSAEYARTRDAMRMLIGSGPYLVDRQDGSIHHIPTTTFFGENWAELYLEQVKGIRPPDPVPAAVRELVEHDGTPAAVRYLRRRYPEFTVLEAKAYADAVRDGHEPPAHLADRTRPAPRRSVLPIRTLAGPAEP